VPRVGFEPTLDGF